MSGINHLLNLLLRIYLIGIAGLIGLIVIAVALVLVHYFALPTTDTLAHWYLDEVVKGASTELDTQYLHCDDYYVSRDCASYRGAEIRNVIVAVSPCGGSSDTIEFALVHFEYRQSGDEIWQSGSLMPLLQSDFQPFGSRSLACVA